MTVNSLSLIKDDKTMNVQFKERVKVLKYNDPDSRSEWVEVGDVRVLPDYYGQGLVDVGLAVVVDEPVPVSEDHIKQVIFPEQDDVPLPVSKSNDVSLPVNKSNDETPVSKSNDETATVMIVGKKKKGK